MFRASKADRAELGPRELRALANENSGDPRMTAAAIKARGFTALLRTSGRSDGHRPAGEACREAAAG